MAAGLLFSIHGDKWPWLVSNGKDYYKSGNTLFQIKKNKAVKPMEFQSSFIKHVERIIQ
jgi:hypothetical protein